MLYNVEICKYEFKFSLLTYLSLKTHLNWHKKEMQIQMEKVFFFFTLHMKSSYSFLYIVH